MEGVVNRTTQALYSRQGYPVPILQEAGWAPMAGLDGRENSHPHRNSISGPNTS